MSRSVQLDCAQLDGNIVHTGGLTFRPRNNLKLNVFVLCVVLMFCYASFTCSHKCSVELGFGL